MGKDPKPKSRRRPGDKAPNPKRPAPSGTRGGGETRAPSSTGVSRSRSGPGPSKSSAPRAGVARPPAGGRASRDRNGAPRDRDLPRAARRETELDRSPRSMLTLYRPDVAEALASLDCAPYRYAQVYQHLFRGSSRPFAEASALPADVRARLDPLGSSTLTRVQDQSSADRTTKLLLATRDGEYVESVVMPYSDRVTVCVSSQVGCSVGCLFCATGAMEFRRNLTAAEIVDQVRIASLLSTAEGRRVSNVVYMGMGEPLLNLQAVLDSIRILTDPDGFGLSHRSLSISTVGIPSGILRLGRAEPQVNLALSLHAPNDVTRATLVPQRFRHPVAEILESAWEHFALTHRKLLVEYVLLRGINDSIDDARSLARLLRGHVVAVNLLPWNPVPSNCLLPPGVSTRHTKAPEVGEPPAGLRESVRAPVFLAPSAAAISAFREVLTGSHIEAVVRRSKGRDIQGACGQLAGRRRATTAGGRPEEGPPRS